MRRSLGCALVVVLALAAAPLATGGEKPSAQRETALEQGVLREVNRVRAAHGLRPLARSGGLEAAAALQSRALLVQGVFEHSSAASGSFGARLRRYYPVDGARAWRVGENLLWSSQGIDPAGAVNLWLHSPAHRKIMLDPNWRELGIGAYGATSAPGVYAEAGPVVVITMDVGSRVPAAG